jgi:phosphopantothenoylcysteine decarboxylase
MSGMRLCSFVVCGAPLASRAHDIADNIVRAGWTVEAVVTPDARKWIDAGALTAVVDGRVHVEHRPVGTARRPERPDAVVIAPATFNTVNKLATGIADTYAHAMLCEVLGEGVPILAVPMVATRLWSHPAWRSHLSLLTEAGVQWLSIHDGTVGEPQVMQHGTGPAIVERFDPQWIPRQLT